MTSLQKLKLTNNMLVKSFQPYLEKYPETKLDFKVSEFNKYFIMNVSIDVNQRPIKKSGKNGFNKTMVGKCIVSFIRELEFSNLIKMNDPYNFIFEMVNDDLPYSVDYVIQIQTIELREDTFNYEELLERSFRKD